MSQRDELFEQWCHREWNMHPRAQRAGFDILDRVVSGDHSIQLASRIVDAWAAENVHILDYEFRKATVDDPWEATLSDHPTVAGLLRGDQGSVGAVMVFAGLTRAELQAVAMHFEGVSVQGIAKALGRTDGTIRVLIDRALYRLAALPEAERQQREEAI